jgi:hypothetical protein
MPRKTVKIEKIIEMGNNILMGDFGNSWFRSGVKLMLENILHDSGTYRGFRYLAQEEVPQGELPGINYRDGMPAPYPERFENTDATRVKFF